MLLKEALKNKDNDYFHLISGHDFPIKSVEFFNDFLSKNKGKQFIEHFTLPSKVWLNGGMERLELYNLYDLVNAKGKYKFVIHRFNQLQKMIGFKRKFNFKDFSLYGGGTWWTLSRECCYYIDSFLVNNPKFLSKFNFTFCAEEIFYQTLILNSPFKNKVINESLRHIVWEHLHGNIPANLDESDLSSIQSSPSLFARRFEYPFSEGLLNAMDEK